MRLPFGGGAFLRGGEDTSETMFKRRLFAGLSRSSFFDAENSIMSEKLAWWDLYGGVWALNEVSGDDRRLITSAMLIKYDTKKVTQSVSAFMSESPVLAERVAVQDGSIVCSKSEATPKSIWLSLPWIHTRIGVEGRKRFP